MIYQFYPPSLYDLLPTSGSRKCCRPYGWMSLFKTQARIKTKTISLFTHVLGRNDTEYVVLDYKIKYSYISHSNRSEEEEFQLLLPNITC